MRCAEDQCRRAFKQGPRKGRYCSGACARRAWKRSPRGKAWSREYHRGYYATHGDHLRAYAREYHHANRADVLRRMKARYWADPEGNRARVRAYIAANREEIRAKARARYSADRAAMIRKMRRWRTLNRDKMIAAIRHWKAKTMSVDPEYRWMYDLRRSFGGALPPDHLVEMLRVRRQFIQAVRAASKSQ